MFKIPKTEKLACEVKFLLDSERVLNEEKRLKEKYRELFCMGSDCQKIDVIYLETPDRAFLEQGWVNRIRWKHGKKKAERTYKKRYPVDGMDEAAVLSALQKARADGFDLSENGYTSELDWGYSRMTLSLKREASDKVKGYQSLAQFSAEDAAAFFEKTMPLEERDWTADQWGVTTLRRAQMIGPVRVLRCKGKWKGVKLTVDICPVSDGSIITELSFKAEDWRAAAETRSRLGLYLEKKGILIHDDSLKTQAVLNACLLA